MNIRGLFGALIVAAMFVYPAAAFAVDDAAAINAGDTAWVLASAALVMLMTPGLAFFYSGMAGRKNVLGVIMQSFFALCVVGIQWVVIGYSLSFGGDIGGFVGNLSHVFLSGVGMEAKGSIPHLAFMIFQGMFAIITVALITGGVAGRMKFSALVLFAVLWTTFIYDPLCHWVWGGGWLGSMGALDFAGGTVVHISSGISALVAALVIGKRKGYPSEHTPPHNLTLTLIGTALLWFGWFGFNSGSALAANGLAALAFVTTNTAACAAALAWVFVEWVHRGKPTVLGAASGAIAGLVAITPAAGFVGAASSIIIGLGAGAICYGAVAVLKQRLGYDDTLDVFGIHGVGGAFGAIATGFFASVGATGLFFGNAYQVVLQLAGIIAAVILSVVGTYIILKIVDALIGLRVNEEDEHVGLDLSQHGESGYNMQ